MSGPSLSDRFTLAPAKEEEAGRRRGREEGGVLLRLPHTQRESYSEEGRERGKKGAGVSGGLRVTLCTLVERRGTTERGDGESEVV